MLRELKLKLEGAVGDPVAESLSADVVGQLDAARLREAQMLGQADGPKAMVIVEADDGVDAAEWRAQAIRKVDAALADGRGLPDEI